MKFSGKVWSDHGTTSFNFGSIPVNGSASQRSICLLSPAMTHSSRGLALTSQYHSLGGSRGRGLLCLTPQLVMYCVQSNIQHVSGFWGLRPRPYWDSAPEPRWFTSVPIPPLLSPEANSWLRPCLWDPVKYV